MNEHKVGDLVLRYYFEGPILGQIRSIGDNDLYAYKIEWLNPEHYSCAESYYDIQEMREGKRRLNEYQAQGRRFGSQR